MHRPLPSYKSPPVVETAVGVEFTPISGWGTQHFGLFSGVVREEFPVVESHLALSSGIESFGPPKGEDPSVEFRDVPDLRMWYISGDTHRLLQVQKNRLIFNWRKGEGDAEYPRFEKVVFPGFQHEWTRFTRFLENQGLKRPDVVQCEVTYVNQIPLPLNEANDWHEVFRICTQSTGEFLPPAETGRVLLNYLMPDKIGRLRVSFNHALRVRDEQPIIQLQLTARGKPTTSEDASVFEWLKLGREWVVRGFTELTTDKMHLEWQRDQ